MVSSPKVADAQVVFHRLRKCVFPFFSFAAIMAPLANNPYIFPDLANNWRLRRARGNRAAHLDLACP